jgi:hypothetical protein
VVLWRREATRNNESGSVQSSPTVEVGLAVMVGIWYCGSISNISISLGIVTCAGRVWWPSSPVPTVVSR